MTTKLYYIRDHKIIARSSENSTYKACIIFSNQWNSSQEHFTINTSGSTGTPKSITITRKQMEASALMTAQALSLQSGDNALVCLNTEYIAGKMMLVRGMVSDLNLYITEPSSNPLLEVPENLQIDFMAVVPLQLEAMMDCEEECTHQLNKMKAIIVGGAPVSFGLAEKIKALECPVYATYGMTETVSHIALKRLNSQEVSEHYKVLEGVKIGQDDRGCLTINSILTNHQTIITNDIVNIIDDQSFEWLGRSDDIINSGGVKIHPEQLENRIREILMKQDINCNLMIAGMPDETLGKKVVLVLETEYITENDPKFLLDILKGRLPRHHTPKEIYYLNGFIYTETGKVKRTETVNFIA